MAQQHSRYSPTSIFWRVQHHFESCASSHKAPILRKDFTIDDIRFMRRVSWEQMAILLIVDALSLAQAQHFYALAQSLG